MAGEATQASKGLPLRILRTKVISGADAAALETAVNNWWEDFEDTTGHSRTANLISIDVLAESPSHMVMITYTE